MIWGVQLRTSMDGMSTYAAARESRACLSKTLSQPAQSQDTSEFVVLSARLQTLRRRLAHAGVPGVSCDVVELALVRQLFHRRKTDGRIRMLPPGSEPVSDAHVSILMSGYSVGLVLVMAARPLWCPAACAGWLCVPASTREEAASLGHSLERSGEEVLFARVPGEPSRRH